MWIIPDLLAVLQDVLDPGVTDGTNRIDQAKPPPLDVSDVDGRVRGQLKGPDGDTPPPDHPRSLNPV